MKAKKLNLAWIMSSVIMLVAALLLMAVVGPGIASAHAKLESSTPADGATVASGLTQVTMNFGEELSVDQSTAQLMMADGTAMQGATATVDRADRTKMTLTAHSPLADGKYTVKWKSVTADDNGIVNGTFSFTVGTGNSGTSGGAMAAQPTATVASMSGGTSGNMAAGNSGSMPGGATGGSLPSTGAAGAMQGIALGVMFAALVCLGAGLAVRKRSRG